MATSLYPITSILLQAPTSLPHLSLHSSSLSSSSSSSSSSPSSSAIPSHNFTSTSHFTRTRGSFTNPSTYFCAATTSSITNATQSNTSATSSASHNNEGNGVEEGRVEEGVPSQEPATAAERVRKPAETTDWIASSLSRRFGLGAGLAWFGFLAFGVISEQLKTRFEVFSEQQGTRDVENATETVLPNKVSYVDLRIGGGSSPRKGDLVVVDLVGKEQKTGQVFVDTKSGSQRPLAFVFGARPYSRGMCEGLESVLMSMKVGGKRKVVVPSDQGFGQSGADFGEGLTVPPGASLEYIVELKTVSISPS